MTLETLLEDFGDPGVPAEAPPPEAPPEPGQAERVMSEEEQLALFEKGYSEGYEDATASADEERRRVGEALAERLRALSATHAEVRAAVVGEVRDLVTAIGDGVLPAMGREGFGAALAEAVGAEVEARASCPVTVSVAPDAVEVVTPMMPEIPGFPVALRGDPDLGEGQAVIGFPEDERELDVKAVVERALAALREWVADARWSATAAVAPDAAPSQDVREAAHG